VVAVNLALMVDEVMPPYLESMDYCSELKIVGGVILFMLPQLVTCILKYMTILHQHTSKSLS
jgi:hypothetical protein